MSDNKHTKFFSKLFASKDLEPDEDLTEDELNAELEGFGVDLSELDNQMAAFKQKLAGKLAIRKGKALLNDTEGETIIEFPTGRENLEGAIRVAEDQLGYGMAARKRENATEDELKQILSDLEKLKEKSDPQNEA